LISYRLLTCYVSRLRREEQRKKNSSTTSVSRFSESRESAK
jgi:hypothetical protein